MDPNPKGKISSNQEEFLKEDHKNKILDTLKEIQLNCEAIKQAYQKTWCLKFSEKQKFENYTQIWLTWLKYDTKKFEEDRFAGLETLSFKKICESSEAASIDEFWKGLNIYQLCKNMRWVVRFTEKARNLISLWNFELLETLLKKLIDFSLGNIAPGKNCEVQEEGPCADMVYLTTTIKRTDIVVLFAILLETTPLVKSNKVVSLKSHHYLKVVDIINKNKDVRFAIKMHKETIHNDPDRWIEPTRDDSGNFIYPLFINSVNRAQNGFHCEPKRFLEIKLDKEQSESYVFDQDRGRWISNLDSFRESYKEIDSFHQSIIDKISQKENSNDFVEFLKKIPNFPIKLTEEQENLVKSAGNVLAIGRSGTGKTMCSILKLLLTELLFKYSMIDKNKKFDPEDLSKPTALHTVFVTASPVLTNEVKQFYEKIVKMIKEKLSKNATEDLLNTQTTDEKKAEKQEEAKKKPENQETADFEGRDFEESSDDEDFQGPSSLESVKDDDFPLFVTARKIIFMIDASLKSPFFMRNKDGEVIGSSSKFEWHNELKGALVINNEYKISRQAREINNSESEPSSSESESSSDSESLKKRLKSRRNIPINLRPLEPKKKKPSLEVDFSLFSKKFYPLIKFRCSYSAVLLWTEISAYIKGSSQSFKYPGYFLPLDVYTSLGRKVSMLSNEDKPKIWSFFMEYERWKAKENAYDMQDVVNYLLNQIHYYGYQGVPVHFMMIDEVQDLTPATLNLLMLVTQKQLFFSGDTAQTIAKGAGFRFCDLKLLLSESKLEPPSVCKLTVNFRTHNQILGLANSVISLLETLFPVTIDEMAKEVSQFDGPMPSFLMSEDVKDLLFFVLGGQDQQTSDHRFKFGCNQVVVVRDQKSKENLPGILKHALCLTVYEIKGLEFDDVILFNFFANSEVPADVWNKIFSCHKSLEADERLQQDSVVKLETVLLQNNPQLSPLCTELKHLYVAVTRAKNRLIIFDDDLSNRAAIEYYWKALDVIDFVTVDGNQKIVSDCIGSTFARNTSDDQWKAQGFRMFSHKYYEQAQKCFEIAGEMIWASRAEAYVLADKATQIIVENESRLTEFTNNREKNRSVLKKEIKEQNVLALKLYVRAGELFLTVANDPKASEATKMRKEAAKCFSSGKIFEKSSEIFKSLHLYGHAAEAEIARGNFEEAGDLLLLKNEYKRAIEAYKLSKNWDKLIKAIYQFKDKMESDERQRLIQKFIPAAFEHLTRKIIPSSEQETAYRRQILLEENIIAEDSDESFSDDQEPEKTNLSIKPEKHSKCESKPKNSEKLEENPIKTDENSIKTDENVIINVKCDSENSQIHNNSSYVLLSSENSFSLLSEKIEDLDPDDEWLQVETGSVIESLENVINPDGSIVSDFSLLESNPKLQLQGKLIKTRLNIKVEDKTMAKLIEYVTMFSEDISSYLKSLRSNSSLMSCQAFKQDWEVASLIDLDEINSETLGLLLDVLEEFGMYRLGLVVCNRYDLVERAGRFILSIAFKYSNLSSLTYAKFKLNIKEQVQRAALAFTALHNVFETINPEYLSISQQNEFDFEVFSGLLLLGYWKKVAYLLPTLDFFAVSWVFAELKGYVKMLSSSDEDLFNFRWLPKPETTQNNALDLQHLLVGLDLILKRPPVSEVPSFYKETWKVLQNISRNQKTLQSLKSAYEKTQKFLRNWKKSKENVDIEVLDAITACSLFLSQMNNQTIIDELCDSSSEDFEMFLLNCNLLIRQLIVLKQADVEKVFIRHCILSPFRVRSIVFSKITSKLPFSTHYAIFLSSPLISNFTKDSLFAIDLEGKTYLASMQETVKVFKDWIMSRVFAIIQARKQKTSSLEGEINSLGESWLHDFIKAEQPYSLSSYFDCLNKTSSKSESELIALKEQLEDFKHLDASDVKTDRHQVQKSIKELKKKVGFLEKEIQSSKLTEKFSVIRNLLETSKFSLKTNFKLTKTTKLALLTYAQVFINSSENFEQAADNHIWMAFEMARISNQLVFFIEMLRSRHRLVVKDGKKVAKLSNVYHRAVGLADLAVFFQFRCFDSLAETALDLVDNLQLEDSTKVSLVQLATVAWSLSSLEQVSLPESLAKFNLGAGPVTKSSGKLRLTLLEKIFGLFSQFVSNSIPDQENKVLANLLCDCLAVVVFYIPKDQPASNLIKKIKNHSSYDVGRKFAASHHFFKLVQESPKIKTKIEGRAFRLGHKEYPDEELEIAWLVENKTIAIHQKLANVMKKTRNSKKFKTLKVSGFESSSFQHASLLELLNRYLADLYHCFYRIELYKSLDLHFLLDQIIRTSKSIVSLDSCGITRDVVKEKIRALEEWKVYTRPLNEKMKEKLRKKWNFKWSARNKR